MRTAEEIAERKVWYREVYLKSEHWIALRKKIIERDGFRCLGCKGTADHVHHLTYERIEKEELEDLISLCRRCHDLAHKMPFSPHLWNPQLKREATLIWIKSKGTKAPTRKKKRRQSAKALCHQFYNDPLIPDLSSFDFPCPSFNPQAKSARKCFGSLVGFRAALKVAVWKSLHGLPTKTPKKKRFALYFEQVIAMNVKIFKAGAFPFPVPPPPQMPKESAP
jgi:hypothetical protein